MSRYFAVARLTFSTRFVGGRCGRRLASAPFRTDGASAAVTAIGIASASARHAPSFGMATVMSSPLELLGLSGERYAGARRRESGRTTQLWRAHYPDWEYIANMVLKRLALSLIVAI